MHVEIDESWNHQLALGRVDRGAGGDLDSLTNRNNLPLIDQQIPQGIEPPWVQYVSALNHDGHVIPALLFKRDGQDGRDTRDSP
jgi:hypothetical protein